MTRISLPTLYQCPACAGYFTRSVLTFLHFDSDVPEWSDGMNGQWWAGIGAPVGRCPTCSKVIWIEDATAIMPTPWPPRSMGIVIRMWHRLTGDIKGRLRDEREWDALPPEIKDANRINSLYSIQDFMEALAVLAFGAEKNEAYVRRRLWWAFNDYHRPGEDGGPVSSPHVLQTAAQANIHRLLALIENDPIHQVERGELLRQLGRFDEAVAVLAVLPADSYGPRASKIAMLAQRRDNQVRKLA